MRSTPSSKSKTVNSLKILMNFHKTDVAKVLLDDVQEELDRLSAIKPKRNNRRSNSLEDEQQCELMKMRRDMMQFEKDNNIDVHVSGMPYVRTMNSENIKAEMVMQCII